MYVWIVGRCVVPSRNSDSVCISMYWPVLRYYPEQCVSRESFDRVGGDRRSLSPRETHLESRPRSLRPTW